jgi:hypothetical protein
MNNLNIFLKDSRRTLVCSLYRNILVNLRKFKAFDEYIYDYLKIFFRNEFKKHDSEFKTTKIYFYLERGGLVLEDLRRINFIDYDGNGRFNLIVLIC